MSDSPNGISALIEKKLQDERKLIAEWLRSKMKPSVLRLHAGEMSAQEVRAVQGFIRYFGGAIERGEYRKGEGE